MYFPPFNNTEDWHFSHLSLRIDGNSALARSLLMTSDERKRKEKRFLDIIMFISFSRVSRLWDCVMLSDWRRKWQPTPVFLPGESQGWGSLVGCRLWGRTESDMTEVT